MGDFAACSTHVPLCSYVFGIRDGSSGAVWCAARRAEGFVAAVAVSSVCARGIRSRRETKSPPFDFAQGELYAEYARSGATEDTLRNM